MAETFKITVTDWEQELFSTFNSFSELVGPEERLWRKGVKHKLHREDATDHSKMEEADEGWLMISIGVTEWMFLLVLAYLGSPGHRAVKQLLLLFMCRQILPVKRFVGEVVFEERDLSCGSKQNCFPLPSAERHAFRSIISIHMKNAKCAEYIMLIIRLTNKNYDSIMTV